MYPSESRVDWIPKGPANDKLTIRPKERCAPRFITKIEGNAVEEGCKVFFEGIVDAQPQPKFSWYFNDEPIIPGLLSLTVLQHHSELRSQQFKFLDSILNVCSLLSRATKVFLEKIFDCYLIRI